MALFSRVGGGIFTKAADVGADLVGKLDLGLEEDDPKNPATIADNVGDNVGDVAGMGSDLFGSFAESSCAALVVMATNKDLSKDLNCLYFPLMISAMSLLGCWFTSVYGIYFEKVDKKEKIEATLKRQLAISTVISVVCTTIAGLIVLPSSFVINNRIAGWYDAVITTCLGTVSGLIIGYSTDYFTSNAHPPVKQLVEGCRISTAINIILGLALGYISTIIPVVLLSLTILISISLLGMFGVALAAIGMLSTLSIGLAIDAYGPISDNAGGIAEMSSLDPIVRERTDALDAAGNTTAAIGKGFAIGSAALVSVALYGAFITRAKSMKTNPIKSIQINDPWVYCSLLLGAMLPYTFSALTMTSVGNAANKIVKEVEEQMQNDDIKTGKVAPDYQKCIKLATKESLKQMITPGILVIATPLILGIFFHPLLVAGLLPGCLLTGIQLAISMSNSGGAWDNTKKLIETGTYIGKGQYKFQKDTKAHHRSVEGDTVGDPLKDTSGPSLNILVKLMAIISLVFASGFSHTSFLAGVLRINEVQNSEV